MLFKCELGCRIWSMDLQKSHRGCQILCPANIGLPPPLQLDDSDDTGRLQVLAVTVGPVRALCGPRSPPRSSVCT